MTAGKAGAIEVIVEVMKKYKSNANVCEQGCKALTNITENGK